MAKELKIQATTVFQNNWDATTRFVVNIGGSRSTKTYSILQLLIVKALESTEPLVISIVRKSLPALRISVMRDFLAILKSLDLSRNKINAICVEHNFRSGSDEIIDFMYKNGYELVYREFSKNDYWFVLRR